ncbi:MAG: hypothetical protein IIC67_10915 [Thaumarchaeota archaeon]|nr:hypothetical protein [Nitrososphaerota archaeon]
MTENIKSTKTFEFEGYLLLGLSNHWKLLNNNNPLVFDVKISNNKLILSTILTGLKRIKGDITNEM